jgi:hypothetical protein
MRSGDPAGEERFKAGERVPPGTYKHVDSPYIVRLESDDTLPARLDGRPTVFVRVQMWSDAQRSDSLMAPPRFDKASP